MAGLWTESSAGLQLEVFRPCLEDRMQRFVNAYLLYLIVLIVRFQRTCSIGIKRVIRR